MSIDTLAIHTALGDFFQRIFDYLPVGIAVVAVPTAFTVAFKLAQMITGKIFNAFNLN
jgi:hypothetical protein